MEVLMVEAFAEQAGKGNPAGVVMATRGLTDQKMMDIAGQVGASETAFLEQLTANSWRNRFFTPRSEVAICGHATIASFFVVSQQNGVLPGHRLTYIQQTKAGELAVQVESAVNGSLIVWMELDRPEFERPNRDIDEILLPLGLQVSELSGELPLVIAQRNRIFLPVNSLERLLKLNPDFEQLSAITGRWGLRGVVPYAMSAVDSAHSTHLRHFAPVAGVNEDPVTGTSNGYLGALLQQSGVFPAGDFSYIGEQGQAVGRAGAVQVRLAPSGVWIGGTACIAGRRQIALEAGAN